MQKIKKELSLAKVYKSWLDGLSKDNKDHPEYKSATRFYYDVVANLLWVQKGLCAYTEMYLVDLKHVNPKEWKKGRFNKFEFLGHLDHYDSSLKSKKGWEWNNFFVVHSDVNVKRKGSKKVNGILKPDEGQFSPFYFLQYDFKTHCFVPNSEREFDLQRKILEDINVLGLNFRPIIDYRREYLMPIIDDVLIGKSTLNEARTKLFQFYTSFEMIVKELSIQK